MEIEDHWRDKDFVRAVAFIDTIIGVLICGFNISRLFVLNPVFPFPVVAYYVSIIISVLFWLCVFTLNGLQIYVAVKLFLQINKEEPEIQPSIQASRRWLLLSGFLLSKVFVKIFIFLLMSGSHPGQTFGWILIAAELFLRVLGIYVVKEFIDDLKMTLKPIITALNPVPSPV